MKELPIIEIKNIGKRYNIAHQRGGYVALRDVLMNIIKAPFSFLKTKAKQAVGLEIKEEFWALKDINLEIKRGEVVGIIGHNGAGKSTLLKILSQITPPTEGEIKIRGRVGSLLEVGTGFHPELTGRENIFLNGAILGMSKKEIAKKFDEIVAFSGIDKFLDTPVKYYSSGMYVRLAFSVAAHMEPDILIVDEVLAVGDAEFQKKCLGKMSEITKGGGRTILFVSHNMGAINELCQKTILLENGIKIKEGPTGKVINYYLESGMSKNMVSFKNKRAENLPAYVQEIKLSGEDGKEKNFFDISENIYLSIKYKLNEDFSVIQLSTTISRNGIPIIHSIENDNDFIINQKTQGEYEAIYTIPKMFLKSGSYNISVDLGTPTKLIQNLGPILNFEVDESLTDTQTKGYRKDRTGLIISQGTWNTKKIN